MAGVVFGRIRRLTWVLDFEVDRHYGGGGGLSGGGGEGQGVLD